jgi:hypothetical protein
VPLRSKGRSEGTRAPGNAARGYRRPGRAVLSFFPLRRTVDADHAWLGRPVLKGRQTLSAGPSRFSLTPTSRARWAPSRRARARASDTRLFPRNPRRRMRRSHDSRIAHSSTMMSSALRAATDLWNRVAGDEVFGRLDTRGARQPNGAATILWRRDRFRRFGSLVIRGNANSRCCTS